MTKSVHIISRVKSCIEEAHSFSQGLGNPQSIQRDYIVNTLPDVSPTEIHIALIELNESKVLNYDADSGLIMIY